MPEWVVTFKIVSDDARMVGLGGQIEKTVTTLEEAKTALAAVELAGRKVAPADRASVVSFHCHRVEEEATLCGRSSGG